MYPPLRKVSFTKVTGLAFFLHGCVPTMPCTVQRSMNLLNEHFVERIQHSAGSVAGVPQMAVFIMYILQRRKLTWGGVPRCVLF